MKHKLQLSLFTIGLISFCSIALLYTFNRVDAFDTAIADYIHIFWNPAMTNVMKVITYSANWQTITLLCLVFLMLPSTRNSMGYVVSASSILTTVLNNLLKQIFHRVRPDVILSLVTPGGYSFPSGHAMSGMVFYGLLIVLFSHRLKNKPAKYCLTGFLGLLIFFIGVSRVYLGVHYPTDILAGWSVGLCLLCIFEYAADRFAGKYVRNQ